MSKSKLNKAMASKRVFALPSHKDKNGVQHYNVFKRVG